MAATVSAEVRARQTADRITTVGTGIDNAVLRISTSFEVRGLVQNLTSFDNATVGSGSVVNDVQFAYNGFQQLLTDYVGVRGPETTSSRKARGTTAMRGGARTFFPAIRQAIGGDQTNAGNSSREK